MTDDEIVLYTQSCKEFDRQSPLVYSDWLREQGRDGEADFWQRVVNWRKERDEGDYNCSMWMMTCGELYSNWSELKRSGCTQCKKWAIINEQLVRGWAELYRTVLPEKLL